MKWTKVGRKRERAAQLLDAREDKSQHVMQVFTHDSFCEEAAEVGFAGYGVWFLDPRNVALLLEGPEQTDNQAELKACITALRTVSSSRPPQVVTDSKYVHDGVTLYMNGWFLLGQKGTNRDPWMELRQVLSAGCAVTKCKHVYNHIGVLCTLCEPHF